MPVEVDDKIFHKALPARFARLVERFNVALERSETLERSEGREAFRAMTRQVVVTPTELRGKFQVTVKTEMAALLSHDGHIVSLGAGTRSGRYPTDIPVVFAA